MELYIQRLNNRSFIASSVALIFVLYIRITRGLDLTDEMQYYGQIKGLLDTGSLFSNDLFIQQSVYILFYPLFFLYHLFFEYEGFVFFGRLIMALLSLGVFLYAYVKLLNLKLSAFTASLTALSLTFAMPYHGVFALSYNTVSQALWIVFLLGYLDWRPEKTASLVAIPILMAAAHPTSAVMVSLLIFIRLLFEKRFILIRRIAFRFFLLMPVCALIFICFSPLTNYVDSLIFSSGYGVGSLTKSSIFALARLFVMLMAALFFAQRAKKASSFIPAFFIVAILMAGHTIANEDYGYSSRIFLRLSLLCALALCWLVLNMPGIELRKNMPWFVGAIFFYAATLGVTSSNGMGQATGALMVGLPLFLAFAINRESEGSLYSCPVILDYTCLLLCAALFVVHWSYQPYRDQHWWKSNQEINTVPEFRFISTSSERIDFIGKLQQKLAPSLSEKTALIAGYYPGLYFILGAQPETCMLYMHSLTSKTSESILKKCLDMRSPDVVLSLDEGVGRSGSLEIKGVVADFAARHGYQCVKDEVSFNTASIANGGSLSYSMCKI